MSKKVLFVLILILIGSYKDEARAMNERGYAKELFALDIKVTPPMFDEGLKDLTVMEGENVVLSAKISGNPVPTIVYYKDGEKLESTNRIKLRSEAGTASITILDVKMEDEGTYGMVVTNSAGSAESSCRLTVLEWIK